MIREHRLCVPLHACFAYLSCFANGRCKESEFSFVKKVNSVLQHHTFKFLVANTSGEFIWIKSVFIH